MKNATMEFQSDLCPREADPAFATKKRVTGCCFGLLLLGLAMPGFGQDEPSTPAHPIPSAPKRSYVPASFRAQPELQCKIYSAEGATSLSITVFTDDDGYARFHAVRATASDSVQRLTADCTNSAGAPYSYSVDLTSQDTFTPRPLDLAKERGTDRPPLKGDPLGYTQAELIQGNYGLRPDPKDTASYARWLAAASMPVRMLEAKHPRPNSTRRRLQAEHPNSDSETNVNAHLTTPSPMGKVTQTTWPWWVGSALIGAPPYAGSVASFDVPKPIPGGDETPLGTAIAIWNGVEGTGANSGLIQGGVYMNTTSLTASYGSFREYCCGDGISNNYGGAFTPNPGDNIFSQAWYCDSQGNINLNGGYGCTLLQDFTTGAALSCTVPNGSPCPSVPALAKWTSYGTDADFVIEDQTPQLFHGWKPTTNYTPGQIAVDKGDPYICLIANTNQEPYNHTASWAPDAPLTAFTDFAPEVTMTGFAYTGDLGTSVQTVISDPLVNLLVDFTNTSSHMIISLGPTAETNFTSSQFKELSGLASNAANAESIGVGPNANGSNVGDAWTLGYTANSSGDYNIYQWQKSGWVQKSGAATHIAVGPEGYPWVINHSGAIYYWNGSAFEPAPGNACASWISVGSNAYGSNYGDPWILGCNEGTNGYNIYQLRGSTWVQQTGQATKLTVGPIGPWIINKAGSVYYWNGTSYAEAPGSPCATDISVGPLVGLSFPFGDAWTTGCYFQSTGYNIYQLQQNGTWVQVPGQANQISLSPDLGVPWIVDSGGHIYQ